MGHRNPQGLYFDKENNYVLETEHGPQGGDEINLIQFNVTKKNVLPNYGWPISSAGEHYGGKVPRNNEKYRKYPLHKSHKKYGFVEPLKSFVPSVAISEIIKIDKKEYVVSTLRSKSLYKFRLNDKNKITDLTKIPIYERVRDLKFIDNKLYLFLESTASIGIVSLNEN
jgi:glucose/arabinose dehydrogenase